MNLLELKDKQNGINITVVITKRDAVQEVTRGDKKLRVAHCFVEDTGGNKGFLSLWNEDCEKYDVGDWVSLINGYNHLFEGNSNLSSGISGMLQKVDSPLDKSSKDI